MDRYSRWAFDQHELVNTNERMFLIALLDHMNPENYFVDLDAAKEDLLTIYKTEEGIRRTLRRLFDDDLVLLYVGPDMRKGVYNKERIKAVQVNFRGQAMLEKRRPPQ